MEIEKAVATFGTEAVLRYRAMAETRHDNEVPESFLRAHIATRLHEQFGHAVQIERLYTALAFDLDLPITRDIISAMGAQRADLAIYENGRPTAAIEIEVFDSRQPLPSTGTALERAQMLARHSGMRIFVGLMICPIIVSLEARIERLHDAFGGNMYVGERQRSRDGQWEWCFASASVR